MCRTQNEVAECHLLLGGPESELVGWHLLDRGDYVLLLPRQDFFGYGCDRVFVLGESCGNRKEKKKAERAWHGVLPRSSCR